MTIGQLIQQELRDRKLTQKWLADKTGLTKNTISSICTDAHRPTQENLDNICKVLEVRMSFSFEPIEE